MMSRKCNILLELIKASSDEATEQERNFGTITAPTTLIDRIKERVPNYDPDGYVLNPDSDPIECPSNAQRPMINVYSFDRDCIFMYRKKAFCVDGKMYISEQQSSEIE